MTRSISVIGGGLAGSEAAWQIARRGLSVTLYEMRPSRRTPAHRTGYLAELVCSNSFRGRSLENAVGLLKAEMTQLGSIIMEAARRHELPAGGALAVSREGFSAEVTRMLEENPLVRVVRREITELPGANGVTVIATGPLTSDPLAAALEQFTGKGRLFFYDAAAPIVTADSINFGKVFRGSRYGKGSGDYLNCPFTEEEYRYFWRELVAAEKHEPHPFEKGTFFEGCLPVEEMARRGEDTLRFGPLKPVGLYDPETGKQPYAVAQLRQDNRAASLYNLVGFQTNLKWPEQKRVFRLIPGLENVEFERFGVMHRNTFLDSPRLLLPTLQTRSRTDLLLAGQLTGVEGYVESAAGGLVAGINAARLVLGLEPLVFPPETAIGALCAYITDSRHREFQPMNIAFGLLPPLERPIRNRRPRKRELANRALSVLAEFGAAHSLLA